MHCRRAVPDCLRVASAGGAESIILSAGGAECMMLSAGGSESMMLSGTLSAGAESAESIFSALPAESMTLSALIGRVIT
jgi:hypothetical protein